MDGCRSSIFRGIRPLGWWSTFIHGSDSALKPMSLQNSPAFSLCVSRPGVPAWQIGEYMYEPGLDALLFSWAPPPALPRLQGGLLKRKFAVCIQAYFSSIQYSVFHLFIGLRLIHL